MVEMDRRTGCSDYFELGLLGREATQRSAMQLGSRFRIAELSLSNIAIIFDMSGFERHRSIGHKRVRKADRQQTGGATWITSSSRTPCSNSTTDGTGCTLPSSPRPTGCCTFGCNRRERPLSAMFMMERCETHRVDDARFLVGGVL